MTPTDLQALVEAELSAHEAGLARCQAAIDSLPVGGAARHLAGESVRWARSQLERALFHLGRGREQAPAERSAA